MRNLLPQEHRFSYDYAMYLHDQLARLLVYGESHGKFHAQFSFRSEEDARHFSKNPEVEIFDWLEERDYSDVLGELLLKSLFPALLSDFCHFVYEALTCARTMKLTVAYALLRKPLRENLLYLEWLLADPEDLLNTFYNEESVELSFTRIGDPSRVRSAIEAAVVSLPHCSHFDPDWLYDLRYNKQAHYSFDALCNKAIHLVTTRESIRTEKQNFNFIFSDAESFESQLNHLFRTLPTVLLYAVEVAEVLITYVLEEPTPDFAEASLRRSIGFVLWGADVERGGGASAVAMSELGLRCPGCDSNPVASEARAQVVRARPRTLSRLLACSEASGLRGGRH